MVILRKRAGHADPGQTGCAGKPAFLFNTGRSKQKQAFKRQSLELKGMPCRHAAQIRPGADRRLRFHFQHARMVGQLVECCIMAVLAIRSGYFITLKCSFNAASVTNRLRAYFEITI
ncbi:hypothetical protein RI056_07780 [Komagataeibacter nataicola]|uniref:hypothetical protein n=1 Tax=Komagataeibacter nataicola TaxID=265960 RepID=UPI0028A7ED0F|nr:hypothetical protein [Komagataeibacter nataicola]WNM10225.1 hypothetical protein RI056_07780 [Komagataeibacter nataicola]